MTARTVSCGLCTAWTALPAAADWRVTDGGLWFCPTHGKAIR